jgi:hypothetical protein
MTDEVAAWFAKYDNPQKDLVLAVRKLILAADKRISETTKWQAPTFICEGNLVSSRATSRRATADREGPVRPCRIHMSPGARSAIREPQTPPLPFGRGLPALARQGACDRGA